LTIAPLTNRLITFAAFTGLFLIYIGFLSKNYYWDGVFFARVIEDAQGLSASLIHPNHLGYTLFGYLLYRGSEGLGFTVRAIYVLQVVSCIASVLSAYVLFTIARRYFRSLYLAWSLTFLFAFAATWWKFSVDADAYILSVLFLLVCFAMIMPGRKVRPLLLVVVFSLAVVFHQLAIFFYPVIVLGLFWQDENHGITAAVKFAVGAFVTVFGTYCLFFYFASNTTDPVRFLRWITSYSPDVSFTFNLGSNLNSMLRSQRRVFFGGRLSLLRGFLNPWVIVLIVTWFTVIVLMVIRFVQAARYKRERSMPLKRALRSDPVAKLWLVWTVVYAIFLFFWLPQHTFYRLFYLPAIVLLIGWVISRYGRVHRHRLALFVAVMAFSNFLFSIFPTSYVQKNPSLALALEMNSVWQQGTVVYYATENADNNLFQYFNRGTVWKRLVSLSQLKSALSSTASVWLDTSAVDQIVNEPGGADWLAQHETLRRELIDRAYRIRFIEVVP
jgi:hypothetical protein